MNDVEAAEFENGLKIALGIALLVLAIILGLAAPANGAKVKPVCKACACSLRTNQCHKICGTGKTCHVDCETKCMHQPGYCPAKKLA